jgi:molybdopterin molybdotransferase
MSPPTEALQRISRLAPLADVFARLDAIARPIPAKSLEPAAAVGATLAADATVTADWPSRPVAMRDGWAVAADVVADAGPYAPVPLSPAPAWVETGQPLPAGTDAVLPLDAVTVTKSGAEAHAPAAAGEGVALPGADAPKGTILRRAGERLRPSDVAVLRAAGIVSVSARATRIKIFTTSVPPRSGADTLSPLIARAVEGEGGIAEVAQSASLESVLVDRACDAVFAIGGTGTGRRDASVKTLARVGKVEVHGFGIAPGETAAIGVAHAKPVLLLPGRLDAALATFLIVGSQLIARLAGREGTGAGAAVKLTRKIASIVGLAEIALVRRDRDGVEPIATGPFAWSALARADGWVLVPPDSEGYPAGATIEMKSLP